MLDYDRVNASEGSDSNKTGSSRECTICHYWYWYFLKINFRFQPKVCDSYHSITQKNA